MRDESFIILVCMNKYRKYQSRSFMTLTNLLICWAQDEVYKRNDGIHLHVNEATDVFDEKF